MNLKSRKFWRNKFLWAFLFNLIYISFIHNINVFYIFQSRKEAMHLQSEIEEIKLKNQQIQHDIDEISSNTRTLEKYARETYYMKRDKEDVFIIK